MTAATTRRRALDHVVPLVIACVPLAYLTSFNTTFYFDWNIHLWMIAYTGEYFRQHLSFPMTFNTNEAIGMPFPLFYGTVFYPIAGAISAVTGAAVALRAVLIAVMWLQTAQIVRLVNTVYPERFIAWSLAAIVTFAVYPMTNLYNRNAIPEFVAVSLLVSACALWLRAIYAGSDRRRPILASAAWLLYGVSALCHPITAVLGGALFFGLVLATGLASASRRELLRIVAVSALLCLLALSPWVYVTLKFQQDLSVSTVLSSVVVLFDSVDMWWVRLMPLPFDIRPLRVQPLTAVSTPYLDAQINFGLMMIAAVLAFQAGRRVLRHELPITRPLAAAAVALVVFVLITSASISTRLWPLLPRSLAFFQFAYRLVSYADLALLIGVIALLRALARCHEQLRMPLAICLSAAVTLMSLGVVVKFTHAAAIQRADVLPGISFSGERDSLRHSAPFLPWDAYSDVVGFAGVLPDAPMVLLTARVGNDFGEAGFAFTAPPSPRVLTNIQAFPWNRIVVDGRELPLSETYTSHRFLSFALDSAASGRPHIVGYRFSPDVAYVVLRAVAAIVLSAWLAGLLAMTWWWRRATILDSNRHVAATL